MLNNPFWKGHSNVVEVIFPIRNVGVFGPLTLVLFLWGLINFLRAACAFVHGPIPNPIPTKKCHCSQSDSGFIFFIQLHLAKLRHSKKKRCRKSMQKHKSASRRRTARTTMVKGM